MQSIIHFFTSLGKVFGGHDLDTVDPNLIRFYRTEYGSGWKDELNFHLYNRNQKKRRLIKMRKPIWAGSSSSQSFKYSNLNLLRIALAGATSSKQSKRVCLW